MLVEMVLVVVEVVVLVEVIVVLVVEVVVGVVEVVLVVEVVVVVVVVEEVEVEVEVMHEFWLADIRDSCIIGLDLLTRWGARVDMARAAITVPQRQWRSSPDGDGTGTLVVAGLWPGSLGLCPVPAFPAALCLPPFLPSRLLRPLMRFGCAVELGSKCSRVGG